MSDRPLVFDEPLVSVLQWHIVLPAADSLSGATVARAHRARWDEPLTVERPGAGSQFPPGTEFLKGALGTVLSFPNASPIPTAVLLALADAPGQVPPPTGDDRDALERHGGHRASILALGADGASRADRAAFALRLVASQLDAGGLGAVIPRAYRAIGASAFAPLTAADCDDAETQLALWTRHHWCETPSGTARCHTHGMEALGLPDFEVAGAGLVPADAALLLGLVARHAHLHGAGVVKAGDTLEVGGVLFALSEIAPAAAAVAPGDPLASSLAPDPPSPPSGAHAGAPDVCADEEGCRFGMFGAYRLEPTAARADRVAPAGPDLPPDA